MTIALATAMRCLRKRHHMSCHWDATETRSSSATSVGAGSAGGRTPICSTVRPSAAVTLTSAPPEESDPRVEPYQEEIRHEDADDGEGADQHHDRAREEHVLRKERVEKQRPHRREAQDERHDDRARDHLGEQE